MRLVRALCQYFILVLSVGAFRPLYTPKWLSIHTGFQTRPNLMVLSSSNRKIDRKRRRRININQDLSAHSDSPFGKIVKVFGPIVSKRSLSIITGFVAMRLLFQRYESHLCTIYAKQMVGCDLTKIRREDHQLKGFLGNWLVRKEKLLSAFLRDFFQQNNEVLLSGEKLKALKRVLALNLVSDVKISNLILNAARSVNSKSSLFTIATIADRVVPTALEPINDFVIQKCFRDSAWSHKNISDESFEDLCQHKFQLAKKNCSETAIQLFINKLPRLSKQEQEEDDKEKKQLMFDDVVSEANMWGVPSTVIERMFQAHLNQDETSNLSVEQENIPLGRTDIEEVDIPAQENKEEELEEGDVHENCKRDFNAGEQIQDKHEKDIKKEGDLSVELSVESLVKSSQEPVHKLEIDQVRNDEDSVITRQESEKSEEMISQSNSNDQQRTSVPGPIASQTFNSTDFLSKIYHMNFNQRLAKLVSLDTNSSFLEDISTEQFEAILNETQIPKPPVSKATIVEEFLNNPFDKLPFKKEDDYDYDWEPDDSNIIYPPGAYNDSKFTLDEKGKIIDFGDQGDLFHKHKLIRYGIPPSKDDDNDNNDSGKVLKKNETNDRDALFSKLGFKPSSAKKAPVQYPINTGDHFFNNFDFENFDNVNDFDGEDNEEDKGHIMKCANCQYTRYVMPFDAKKRSTMDAKGEEENRGSFRLKKVTTYEEFGELNYYDDDDDEKLEKDEEQVGGGGSGGSSDDVDEFSRLRFEDDKGGNGENMMSDVSIDEDEPLFEQQKSDVCPKCGHVNLPDLELENGDDEEEEDMANFHAFVDEENEFEEEGGGYEEDDEELKKLGRRQR